MGFDLGAGVLGLAEFNVKSKDFAVRLLNAIASIYAFDDCVMGPGLRLMACGGAEREDVPLKCLCEEFGL